MSKVIEVPEHVEAMDQILDLVAGKNNVSGKMVARATRTQSVYFKLEAWLVSRGYARLTNKLEVWYVIPKQGGQYNAAGNGQN